jgi:aspartate aminotransferase
VASDDIYEHICLDDGEAFCNILMACPELYDRAIVLNGVSKSYSMTGWRIGYAAGPLELIQAMENIQSQSTSNPASISQVAAEAALNGDQAFIPAMNRAFRERHDYVVATLNGIRGVRCLPSRGAFYAFPLMQEVIDRLKLKDDVDLGEYLINEAGVALVPGSAFGAPGYMRLSFATGLDNLRKGLQRIIAALG